MLPRYTLGHQLFVLLEDVRVWVRHLEQVLHCFEVHEGNVLEHPIPGVPSKAWVMPFHLWEE